MAILNGRARSYLVVRHEGRNLLVWRMAFVPARSWRVRPDPLTDDQQDTVCEKLYWEAYGCHGRVNLDESFNIREDDVDKWPQTDVDWLLCSEDESK